MCLYNWDVIVVGKFIKKINLKNRENLFGIKGYCIIYFWKLVLFYSVMFKFYMKVLFCNEIISLYN